MKYSSLILGLLLVTISAFAQEKEIDDNKSNLQVFTPSKLLNKGQWDVKFFNNLYTQTRNADANGDVDKVNRSNFFTSTLEVFTGVSANNRINVGAIFEYRSNSANSNSLSVFNFEDSSSARNGLSSIAPAIKIQPIENIGNFSIQSALHIPLLDETGEGGNGKTYLDQTAWVWQNRLFYDHTFGGGDWQFFGELNTEYNFGDDQSFANQSLVLAPGAFLSYFPTQSVTVLGFVQHWQQVGDFTKDFTSVGLGAKYQLTQVLNLEALVSNFVRGTDTGLGQSFNLGLRALF